MGLRIQTTDMLRAKTTTLIGLCFMFSWLFSSAIAAVTYDHRAIMINGRRRILISGSIHYPRSTPDMWPWLIQQAKEGGLDVIQTYVFWNGHEPTQGNYYFQDRYDLVRFIKLVHQAGLYVHLRIGPYVCAEWNLGGFPVWLKYVPGISFRTNNGPFKWHMQRFVQKIVTMMKAESLFETQGGPIILSQIENEYGPVEWEIGAPGKAYTAWAAQMAVGLNTGVPWVMCKQDDAPDPVIDACNGFYCENYRPNKVYKPKMWTEVWTGWYTEFGAAVPKRPAEDTAYAVARFVQNGGAFFNYYMYHGGTNFERTAGGPFMATSYDYDAPIDEYGWKNEPKWGHLRDLHRVIKSCEAVLVSTDPVVSSIGRNQQAYVFRSNAGCAAFLANYDPGSAARVSFGNVQYDLPAWSVSILPDCKTLAYNTAKVSGPRSDMKFAPVIKTFAWQSHSERIAFAGGADTKQLDGLWEQIYLTRDTTDYLWYLTDITIGSNEGFLKTGQHPVLTVNSAGHALHVYVNGVLSGTAYGSLENPKLTFSSNIQLRAGVNKLALLSVSVGTANVGVHFETWNVGVLGPVTLKGLNSGIWDMSKWKWSYKIGLTGEALHLYSGHGGSAVPWNGFVKNQPLTWYRTSFDAPGGNAPLALDLISMGKGIVWINGRMIGRHWPAYTAKGNCGACNYAGLFSDQKCRMYCGEPSQRWYLVPRSWLVPKGNLLVMFEEFGGDPGWVSLVQRST